MSTAKAHKFLPANLRGRLEKRLGKLTPLAILPLFFHWLVLPLLTIPAWFRSLQNSMVLLNGQWSRYTGFDPLFALNNLFYRTQWININRHGRSGISPNLGVDPYPIANFWHLSNIASYLFSNAGAVTSLVGVLALIAAHAVWFDQSSMILFSFALLAICFFSSFAYIMAFARQNYQILAWVWLPLFYYGILNEQWFLAALAATAASTLGITAFVYLGAFTAYWAILQDHYALVFLIAPAGALQLLRFLPLMGNNSMASSVIKRARQIGVSSHKARYRREREIALKTVYFASVYLVVIALLWWSQSYPPLLVLFGLGFFCINQIFIRFADDQSVVLLVNLAIIAQCFNSDPCWFVIIALLLALNPMPLMFNVGGRCRLDTYAPFDTEAILAEMRNFLNVPKGSKVLFAFNDPGSDYHKIFDGFRQQLEVPLCAAAEKEFHVFPSWHAIFQTNDERAPTFWGRSPNDVLENMQKWNASMAIIYQTDSNELGEEWTSKFDVISTFSWKTFDDLHNGEILKASPTGNLIWRLIQPRSTGTAQNLCQSNVRTD